MRAHKQMRVDARIHIYIHNCTVCINYWYERVKSERITHQYNEKRNRKRERGREKERRRETGKKGERGRGGEREREKEKEAIYL